MSSSNSQVPENRQGAANQNGQQAFQQQQVYAQQQANTQQLFRGSQHGHQQEQHQFQIQPQMAYQQIQHQPGQQFLYPYHNPNGVAENQYISQQQMQNLQQIQYQQNPQIFVQRNQYVPMQQQFINAQNQGIQEGPVFNQQYYGQPQYNHMAANQAQMPSSSGQNFQLIPQAMRQRDYSAQQQSGQLLQPYHHQGSGAGSSGRASQINPHPNANGAQMPQHYGERAGYMHQQQYHPRRDQAAGEQRHGVEEGDGCEDFDDEDIDENPELINLPPQINQSACQVQSPNKRSRDQSHYNGSSGEHNIPGAQVDPSQQKGSNRHYSFENKDSSQRVANSCEEQKNEEPQKQNEIEDEIFGYDNNSSRNHKNKAINKRGGRTGQPGDIEEQKEPQQQPAYSMMVIPQQQLLPDQNMPGNQIDQNNFNILEQPHVWCQQNRAASAWFPPNNQNQDEMYKYRRTPEQRVNDWNNKRSEPLSACKRRQNLFGDARGKLEHELQNQNMRKLDFSDNSGDRPRSAVEENKDGKDPEVYMASPDGRRKMNQENDMINGPSPSIERDINNRLSRQEERQDQVNPLHPREKEEGKRLEYEMQIEERKQRNEDMKYKGDLDSQQEMNEEWLDLNEQFEALKKDINQNINRLDQRKESHMKKISDKETQLRKQQQRDEEAKIQEIKSFEKLQREKQQEVEAIRRSALRNEADGNGRIPSNSDQIRESDQVVEVNAKRQLSVINEQEHAIHGDGSSYSLVDEEYKKDVHDYHPSRSCSSDKNNVPQQKESENQIEGSTKSNQINKDVKETKNKKYQYEVEDSVSINEQERKNKNQANEANAKQSNDDNTERQSQKQDTLDESQSLTQKEISKTKQITEKSKVQDRNQNEMKLEGKLSDDLQAQMQQFISNYVQKEMPNYQKEFGLKDININNINVLSIIYELSKQVVEFKMNYDIEQNQEQSEINVSSLNELQEKVNQKHKRRPRPMNKSSDDALKVAGTRSKSPRKLTPLVQSGALPNLEPADLDEADKLKEIKKNTNKIKVSDGLDHDLMDLGREISSHRNQKLLCAQRERESSFKDNDQIHHPVKNAFTTGDVENVLGSSGNLSLLFRNKESKEANPLSNEVQNGTSQSDHGLNQAISANILQEIKEILNRLHNKNQYPNQINMIGNDMIEQFIKQKIEPRSQDNPLQNFAEIMERSMSANDLHHDSKVIEIILVIFREIQKIKQQPQGGEYKSNSGRNSPKNRFLQHEQPEGVEIKQVSATFNEFPKPLENIKVAQHVKSEVDVEQQQQLVLENPNSPIFRNNSINIEGEQNIIDEGLRHFVDEVIQAECNNNVFKQDSIFSKEEKKVPKRGIILHQNFPLGRFNYKYPEANKELPEDDNMFKSNDGPGKQKFSQSQMLINTQNENDSQKEIIHVSSTNSQQPIIRIDSMSIQKFSELMPRCAHKNRRSSQGKKKKSSHNLPGFYDQFSVRNISRQKSGDGCSILNLSQAGSHEEIKVDQSQRTKFLTPEELLGEGKQICWTDLSQYYPERNQDEQVQEIQRKYARTSNRKNCLVIEPVGLFFQLIDPSKDVFSIKDALLKEIKCTGLNNQQCIALIKIWPQGILKQMRRLHQFYELIIFTYLPKNIMDQIYELVQGLRDLVSHTLCNDDLLSNDECHYKDLNFLAHNRLIHLQPDPDDGELTQSEIMVIDTAGKDGTMQQQETFAFIKAGAFTDNVTYPNLQEINIALKQYRQGAYDGLVEQEEPLMAEHEDGANTIQEEAQADPSSIQNAQAEASLEQNEPRADQTGKL